MSRRHSSFKLGAVAQAFSRMHASAVHRSELEMLLSNLSSLEIAMGEHCAYQEAMLSEAVSLTDDALEGTPRFDPAYLDHYEDRYGDCKSGTPEFQDCVMTVQRLNLNFERMVETEQSIVNSYRAFLEKSQQSGAFDWLKDENSRLKDSLKSFDQSQEESPRLRSLYDQECSKVNKLNGRLNQLQTELIELQDLVDELTGERSRLEAMLDEAGGRGDCKKCKKYKDRVTAGQNKVVGQQEEIAELKTNLALARQRDAFQ